MLVGAKLYDLTEDLLWFVCGLYVGILTVPQYMFFFFVHFFFVNTCLCVISHTNIVILT